jgi:hypothetical protein
VVTTYCSIYIFYLHVFLSIYVCRPTNLNLSAAMSLLRLFYLVSLFDHLSTYLDTYLDNTGAYDLHFRSYIWFMLFFGRALIYLFGRALMYLLFFDINVKFLRYYEPSQSISCSKFGLISFVTNKKILC